MDDFSKAICLKNTFTGNIFVFFSKIDSRLVYFAGPVWRQFFTHQVYIRFMLIPTVLTRRRRWPSINCFPCPEIFHSIFKIFPRLFENKKPTSGLFEGVKIEFVEIGWVEYVAEINHWDSRMLPPPIFPLYMLLTSANESLTAKAEIYGAIRRVISRYA